MIDRIDIDFRDVLGAIRDQAARSTCLSHAVTVAHEYARGSADPLSPEYLHYFAANGQPGGCTVDAVATALEQQGQPFEYDCSYQATDPSGNWAPAQDLAVFRRLSKHENSNAAVLESALTAGKLPILGLGLPQPFFDPHAPFVLSSGGSVRAQHAVTCVGMGVHAGQRVYCIRNSWGDDWADGGYAWLDEHFIEAYLIEVLQVTEEVKT